MNRALLLGPRLVPASAWLLGVAAGSWILLGRLRLGRRRVAFPLDALVLGLMSLLESVPLLILVLAAAAVQRPSLGGLVVLLSLTCWTTPARLMRAEIALVSGGFSRLIIAENMRIHLGPRPLTAGSGSMRDCSV